MGSIPFDTLSYYVIKIKNVLLYVLDYQNKIFYLLKFYVLFEILFCLNCEEFIISNSI